MASSPEIDELHGAIAALTRRVWLLEQAITAPAQEPARTSPPEPVLRPEPASAAPVPAPALPRPAPPAQARPAIDWADVGARVFTARTLAWAGGVATALGVVLLFVMAASRGWVTPPMRVGLGVVVSMVLLAAAVELDRRRWRADSILAAAGAGIGGLYTCLWSATSLYGWIDELPAVVLAGLVAALAIGVALRIRRESLAGFGIVAAMLAPVLVSGEVTPGGMLFTWVMACAVLPLDWRCSWRRALTAAWLTAGVCIAGLFVNAATGFGLAVVDAMLVAALFLAMALQLELRRAGRESVSRLGWLTASSGFTVSLGAAFLYGGDRMVHGHRLAGLALLVVAVAWALAAAAPSALRRPHANLTDLLAAFALTALAAGTGLLAGGPAMVCAWAAEAVMLIAAAERVSRRSTTRQGRLLAAAGAYLALATIQALVLVAPTAEQLPRIGAGSTAGMIALVAVIAGGIALCIGTRRVQAPVRPLLFVLPAAAAGYLPLWSLDAEWAVVATAAMSAALMLYRGSGRMIPWLPTALAAVVAAGWWVTGMVVALVVTAPADVLIGNGWDALGAADGLAGLIALLISASVFCAGVQRGMRDGGELLLLVPYATLAYLVAEAVPVPDAIWIWLTLAGATSAVALLRPVRSRLAEGALLWPATGLLVLGVVSTWSADRALEALTDHGRTDGWESMLLATAAAFLVAAAVPRVTARTWTLAVPLLLGGHLVAMLLPGEFAVAAWALVAAATAAVAAVWPSRLRNHLDRAILAGMATGGALSVAGLVLLSYETPRMLFQANADPADGLVAAAAATVALAAAAWACRAARLRIRAQLVYTAGAAALWTLAAAILGATQLRAGDAADAIRDAFQQGHVLVSLSWVLVGLALVVSSIRADRRDVRMGGIALLFVALGKLFLHDLAFLTAMARAVSFIATGSVLLLAALLLQRFTGPFADEEISSRPG